MKIKVTYVLCLICLQRYRTESFANYLLGKFPGCKKNNHDSKSKI